MSNLSFFIYLAVMAGVTYLIRMLPLVLIKKRITNRLLLSFLYYIPYAVLSVMTIPAIFYSTSYAISACAGFLAAVITALYKKGLLTVAVMACSVVLITEAIIRLVI